MTPAARVQAASDILDQILAGAPAEKALTGWARRSRFAGSKDRAAIRDHVFDALRCKRSFAALGGAETGRVTSGGFGPTVGGPVAMGYVETAQAAVGTALEAVVRGKPVACQVAKLPFATHRYYRG